MNKTKERYWILVNGNNQPIYNIYNMVYLFWGNRGKNKIKDIIKESKKRGMKKKRYLRKATILWKKIS